MDNPRNPADRLARQISTIATAPVVAVPVFVLINIAFAGSMAFCLIAVCIIFATFIPAAIVLVWSRHVRKTDRDIPDRADRPLPLACAIISYAAGTAVLLVLHAPWLVTGLMFCYATNTCVVLCITFFWKISIHAMGITGPATALAFATGIPGLLLALLAIPVMWSRVRLRRHTTGQVLAGFALGFILTGIQLPVIRAILGG
jgi:membrane-associated phospholipid phosphatase